MDVGKHLVQLARFTGRNIEAWRGSLPCSRLEGAFGAELIPDTGLHSRSPPTQRLLRACRLPPQSLFGQRARRSAYSSGYVTAESLAPGRSFIFSFQTSQN